MTKFKPSGPSRLETVLAYMGAGIIGLSLLSIVITLVRSFFGETTNLALFAQIPLIALPIGFVLVLVLLVLSIRRKGRENKQ
jgi:TRAP-type C4-dicarboxylate transport system permease small subunit